MPLQHKQLSQISRADIDALISNAVTEGRTIDYKQALPHQLDEKKKDEFCFDVSAFANAAGGDILYGIPERRDAAGKPTGIPEAATGIEAANFDTERLRLEAILRSRIQPRVPGVQFAQVAGDKGPIFILRVPQSWIGPHMVVHDEWVCFYSRGSSGNQRLDAQQIRLAFAATEAIPNRIRAFRDERLGKIIADETPVEITSNAKLVIHLIPLTIATGSAQYPVGKERLRQLATPEISRIDAVGVQHHQRYNLDGVVVWAEGFDSVATSRRSCRSYVQVFRTGALEAISALDMPMGKWMPERLGQQLREYFQHYVELLRELAVNPPLSVMISLLRVKGFSLYIHADYLPIQVQASGKNHPFDRDVLLLPDVLLDDLNVDVRDRLTPILDALWQAGGWPKYYERP